MNKRLIVVMICLVMCLFMSFSAVSAGDDVDNATISAQDSEPINSDDNNVENISKSNDEVLGNGTPGTFSELAGKINAANDGWDWIQLDKDYVFTPGIDDSYVNGIPFVKNWLRISGNGHKIDGAGQARILQAGLGSSGHVSLDHVWLEDIHFTNARNTTVTDKNDAFGALEMWGTAIIDRCNFTNNYAYCAAAIAIGSGTSINVTNCTFKNNTGYGQGGGAIRLRTWVHGLKIEGCWFENNYGNSYGGAVHSDSGKENRECVVYNCDFINNSALLGAGGLFFATPGGVVVDSRFRDNHAPNGGAIYWHGVDGEVRSSNFTRNNASLGGAVYASNLANVTIRTSNFERNTADNGSAIYLDDTGGSSIASCSFYSNVAEMDGGAVYVKGKFLQITDSNFTGDVAKNNGGSIFLDVGSYIHNCQFKSEHADNDGGGIYLYSKIKEMLALPPGIELGVFLSNFTNCSAGHDGGAGYVKSNFGVVKDVVLKDCTAANNGGAGYIWGDYGRLIDSQLINNTAVMNGGALYWEGNNGTITNTRYRLNKVIRGNGGGIYWEGDNGTIIDSNFTMNIADPRNISAATPNGNGGALYWEGDNGKIKHCEFDKSISKNNGAGAYIKGDNINVTESIFTLYNSTHGNGGALYVEGSHVKIVDSDFDRGVAQNGAAIYISGNSVHIHDSNFTHNHANGHGGTVYIAGDNGKIINSKMMLSYTLSGYGGCIYIAGDKTSIDHSNFTNNSATKAHAAVSEVNGGSIYIKGDDTNITYSRFQFGSATHGGAIYINGTNTHILHSNFINLGASKGESSSADALGGAIFVAGDDTVISYTYFNQTNAGKGGAIYVSGNRTEISHGAFDFHRAVDGGAIYLAGANTNIIDFKFTHLNVTGKGGAIYVAGDDAVISKLDFSLGQANQGGAIYVEGDRTEISHSNFTRMSAVADGGAIYVAGERTNISSSEFGFSNAVRGGALFIEGNGSAIESAFHHCFANGKPGTPSAGGAIYVSGNDNEIKNSNFQITQAIGGNGGAIYAGGKNTTINNIHSMVGNAIRTGPGNIGNGGSIYVAGDDVKVKDSEFTQYLASDNGGAIFVQGDNVNITKSYFHHGNARDGAAIYIMGSGTHVTYSNFTQMGATFDQSLNYTTSGGAIYVAGDDTVISNGMFTKTNAGRGGAIYVAGDRTEISDNDFTRHNAVDGGVIYIEGDDTNITDSSFEEVISTNRGGAIYVGGEGTHITQSNFTKINTTLGGAIFVNGSETIIEADFNECNVLNSTESSAGGAIYVEGNNNIVRNSKFNNTVAWGGNGGAIYAGGVNTTISNIVFTNCKAIRVGHHEGNGGVIYVQGDGVNIGVSEFGYCNATDKGGALFIYGDDVNITGSYFHHGDAFSGRAIYIEGSNTHVTYSNFTQMGRPFDSALHDDAFGGAIYVAGNDTVISHDGFSSANAGRGGAIYVAGERTEISHSNFTRHAAVYGGAIYVEGNDTNITENSFFYIRADNKGGAIYVGGIGTHVTSSDFRFITSNQGGAIFIRGSQTVIESNFTFCNANGTLSSQGGAIYVEGDYNRIQNSHFNATSSYKGDGGAVYIQGDGVEITNSEFTRFNATGNGGAVYVEGDYANITESVFIYGDASNGRAVYIKGSHTHLTHSNLTNMGSMANVTLSSTVFGGAVFVEGDDTVISHDNFARTNAHQGGAIYIAGERTDISQSTFQNHNANIGGAIYIEGNDTNISQSSFNSIKSEVMGGAVYVGGVGTHITQSNFTQAKSSRGGAIYVEGSETLIEAKFTNCAAERGFSPSAGGAIYVEGDNNTINNSEFTSIRAVGGNGGAIYAGGRNTRINNITTNSTVAILAGSGNTGKGGAIFIEGDEVKISASEFTQFKAFDNGGAIYVHGDDANITTSYFHHGDALNGRAIYIEGSRTHVLHSNFTNMGSQGTADPNSTALGGAIYVAGDDTVISHGSFNRTNAAKGGAVYIAGENTEISYTSFKLHNAFEGGAIYVGGNNANITGLDFNLIESSTAGGAIYISGVNATVSKSSFNQTKTDGNGGSIYIIGRNANVSDSNFTHAHANYGGAIYIKGLNTTVSSSIFSNNNASTSDGGSVYIDGENAKIDGSNFTHAHANYGGFVYIRGSNSNISNSRFSISDAKENGGAVYVAGINATIYSSSFTRHHAKYGGAIYISGENTNVFNSNVSDSQAYSQAGGVFLGPHTYVYNSTFTNNTARAGGAMYNAGGTAIVELSNFTFNKAHVNDSSGGHGGAIYWQGGSDYDSILACYFAENEAINLDGSRFSCGGAIYWASGVGGTKNAKIINSTFYKNHASRHGGAIDWFSSDNGLIYNCNFTENIADCDGGALYAGDDGENAGKNLTVTYCNFTDNCAGIRGGAISLQFFNSHVKYGLFVNNSASEGGSIFMGNEKAKTTEYVGCIFIDSHTHARPSYYGGASCSGGVAYIKSSYINFTDCKFYNSTVHDNRLGGAIYFDVNAVNSIVERCEFTNSTNASEGGAIYSASENLLIKDSNFTLNQVTKNGGAIYITGKNNTVVNSRFNNNTAQGGLGGGAILINSQNNHIKDSYFNCNNATHSSGHGGAILVDASDNEILNSIFNANHAGREGGAICINRADSNQVLDKLTIENSTAGVNAGAIFAYASNVNITNSKIRANRAPAGGAIFILGSYDTLVSNTNITNNNATKGSGIYVKDSNYTLSNVILLDNQAHANRFDDIAIRRADNGTYYLTAVFRGNDNLLNGIWSENSANAVNFTNVTYWGVKGISKTSNVPDLSDAEAGMNITVTRTRSAGDVVVTDEEGRFRYYFDDDKSNQYAFTFTHNEDLYYTALTSSKSITATTVTITVTNITFEDNATVNVTLKGADGRKLTGIVNITINNTCTFKMQVTNGFGSLNNVSGLNAGIYNATVTFAGNEDYLGSENSTLFEVRNVVNIEIIKKADLNNVSVGDLVNFTITVTNFGPSNATNVSVTDNLPAGLAYVKSGSNITDKGVRTLVNGAEVITWKIGNMTKGQSVLLWVLVNTSRNGTFGNVAWVNSTEGGQNSSNVTNITVKPVVNLTVVKKSNLTGNALVGDLVNFTITVTNHGPSNATKVQIVDELNSTFHFVKASGNITPVNGKLIWEIPKLLTNSSISVWVVVKVMDKGNFTNMAVVNSSETNTTSTNTTNITVNPKVILEVVKTAENAKAHVGDLVNFTIVVTNKGLSNATGVNVTDLLPSGMQFINAGGNITGFRVTNETLTNGSVKVIWHIDKIINGTSVKLWILVNLTKDGNFTNVAFAVSNENKTNVTNSTNITVKPVVNILINKTVDKTNVSVGDEVVFTITVENKGPSNATGVNVTDVLDKRLKLIKANATQGTYANGKWAIGNITAGGKVVLTLRAKIISNGTISNIAFVNCSENTTDKNSSSNNITANPKVNLTIVKIVNLTGNISVGDLVNFTITVTNNGPSNATNVTVVDDLVSAFRFEKANGTAVNKNQRVTWTFDKLANGTSVSVWLQVRVVTNGTFTNVAIVNCNENRTNITSNDTNVTVEPKVNLTIIKKANVTNATVGDKINYTITVINNGPSNATDVMISDILNSALEFVSATGRYTREGQKVNWTIDKIVNGTNVTVYLIVKVVNNGTVSNVAHVNCSENRTDIPSNGTNVTVTPNVNLTVVKTSPVVNASVGDLINFTIVVTNNGLSNATGVNVTDLLPADMQFINAGGNITGFRVTNETLTNGSAKVIWHIDKIMNGTSVKLWILVNLTKDGNFTNVAFAVSNENKTNVTNSTNITVKPVVNLVINKTVDKTNVSVGDEVIFTITVENKGPSNATGVNVSDVLDNRLKLVKANATQGSYANGKWAIGNITSGGKVVLTIRAKILSNGTISNIAVVNCIENTTDKNSSSDNITANPRVNLTIVKTVNLTGNVSVGDLVNFTITITNNGPSNATNVTVVDDLVSAFRFENANGTAVNKNQRVTWTFDKLANGTSVSVWLQVRVVTNGTFTNVAIVNCNENKTNITSNDTNVTVEPKVNLTIIKKANVTNATVGDKINYTITVINNGPSNATDVRISDVLNSALEFVSATGRYTRNGQKVNWTIDKIVNGTNVTVYLIVKVVNNGTVSNVAHVNCSENRTDIPSNGTNVTVTPNVNLTVVKTSPVVNASVGDLINFTIVVTNNGLSNATDVNVTDLLPAGMQFINAGGNITGFRVTNETLTNGSVKVIWHIDKIINGTGMKLWILVNLTKDGNFTNIAFAVSNENKTNVTNSTNITVKPVVNLVINKTVDKTNVSVGDEVVFTITVINKGPSNATGVNVSDVLDKRLKLVKANATQGTYANGKWAIGNITSGGKVVLTIRVKILSNGTISNIAFVNCSENTTNGNSSSDNITANPKVNLTIVKSVNLTGNVSVGDLVNFTITVTNNGPSNATNVTVVDDLVSAFRFEKANGTYVNNTQRVTWTFDKLANGTSVSVWLQVRVVTNGTFANVAVVNCNENKTNVTSNDTNVTVEPKVNLTIIKKVNVTNATVGDMVNYTITVINNGPSNATDVRISDVLNSALGFISATGRYNHEGQKVNWTIDKIVNGTNVTVYLIVKVVNNGTVSNVAHVNCSENRTDVSSNGTNVTVTPNVNLTVVKTVVNSTAHVGDLVNFTIVVTNNGLSNATGVNVTDLLPLGMQFINAGGNITGFRVTNETLTNGSAKVIWHIDKIINGTSVKLWILVNLTKDGNFTNVAFAASNENTTNSTNSTNITVKPVVNLIINKTVDKTNVSVGDEVIFTITVENKGPSNATGVNVTDVLDKCLKLVKANATQGSYADGKWAIGNITSGGKVVLTLRVKIISNGTISNIAFVNCSENTTDKNSSSDNITANPKVNLTIIKKANVTNATVGDKINYTITVINNGPSNATDVRISDVLNSALEFVSATGRYAHEGQKVNWTIDKIVNGTNVTVYLIVKVVNNGTVSNVAHVNCYENRTDVPSNETNITVSPNVNLAVVKTTSVGDAHVGDLVNFTIIVTNNGLSNATGVNVTDCLPDGMTYETAGSNVSGINVYNRILANGTHMVIWQIHQIMNGSSVKLWVQVNLTLNGTFTNTAFAASNENNTNTSNSTNLTVKPSVNLIINKKVNKTEVYVGDIVEYTIEISNNGSSDATGVNVTDVLDGRLEYVTSNATQGRYDNAGHIWAINNITSGRSVKLTIIVKVISNGTISNMATVSCSENTTVKNSTSENITAKPQVSMTVVKTAENKTAKVGDLVNFTITVTNNGLSNATGVNVTDKLPDGMSYVDCGSSIGIKGENTSEGVVWHVDRIANGTSIMFWVQVRMTSNGTFENVAVVKSNENTTNSTNGTNITVRSGDVDLEIFKTVSATQAHVGEIITYTITVINKGPATATGVKVYEKLKGSVKIIEFHASKGSYDENAGIWEIGEVGVNEPMSVNLTLNVCLLDEGTVENSVSVNSTENDTDVSNNNFTSQNVTVSKWNTPIDLTCINITYGEDETIKVTLPREAGGKVNITVDGVPYNDYPIDMGVVELTVQNLNAGDYNVTVAYGGDGKYSANSTNASFNVAKVKPTIRIEVADIWYGEVEVLNVTVNAPGFVNITVNNKTITLSLDHSSETWNVLMAFNALDYDGKATWNIENLKVAHYPVSAVYLGSENYESVSGEASFNVKALPSCINVTADDIYVGENASIQVSVTPGATGNVTVTLNGRDYTVNLTDGKAQINVSGLKAGDYTVKVKYNGDEVYAPSENATAFKVKKFTPPIKVDSHDIYVGDDEKITVTLPDDATGTVTIEVGGKRYTALVKDGKAEFTVAGLKAGKYTVDAAYSGDDKYLPVSGSDTFKVSKLKPDIDVDAPDITVAQDGTITVTLPDDATGRVTIEVEGKRYTAPVKDGVAVFKIPGLKLGSHDIRVWYSGDDKYRAGETTGDINVLPAGEGNPGKHAAEGLEKHATGNPIIVLLIAAISLSGVAVRRFKK